LDHFFLSSTIVALSSRMGNTSIFPKGQYFISAWVGVTANIHLALKIHRPDSIDILFF
jgi:hypothetical protein